MTRTERDQMVATDSAPEPSKAALRCALRFLLDRLAGLGEDVDADSVLYGPSVRLVGHTRRRVVQVARRGFTEGKVPF